MAEPRGVADLIDRPLPDLTLPSTRGEFALRAHVGVRPQVLFFYVKNGTPT
jgi:peroxiredoxin